MRSGWQEYFATVPDYWIKVDQIVSEGNAVILFGSARGTFVPKGGMMKPENKWETPAVLREHFSKKERSPSGVCIATTSR